MKLTLSRLSRDGHYEDRKIAHVSTGEPYALSVRWKRYHLTIYRWYFPTICLSKDRSDKPEGGQKENWAQWVLWQENPWRSFKFWNRNHPHDRSVI